MVAGDRIGMIGPNGAGKTSLLGLSRASCADARQRRPRHEHQDRVLRSSALAACATTGRCSTTSPSAKARARRRQARRDRRAHDGACALPRALPVRRQQATPEGLRALGRRTRAGGARQSAEHAAPTCFCSTSRPTISTSPRSARSKSCLEIWPGCALVVSHDRYFLDRRGDVDPAFEGDGSVTRYPGGYEPYRSLRKTAETVPAVVETAPPTDPQREAPSPSDGRQAADVHRSQRARRILDEVSALEDQVPS